MTGQPRVWEGEGQCGKSNLRRELYKTYSQRIKTIERVLGGGEEGCSNTPLGAGRPTERQAHSARVLIVLPAKPCQSVNPHGVRERPYSSLAQSALSSAAQ